MLSVQTNTYILIVGSEYCMENLTCIRSLKDQKENDLDSFCLAQNFLSCFVIHTLFFLSVRCLPSNTISSRTSLIDIIDICLTLRQTKDLCKKMEVFLCWMYLRWFYVDKSIKRTRWAANNLLQPQWSYKLAGYVWRQGLKCLV